MVTDSKITYYLLREGAIQEEPASWADLEELARSGALLGQSRIFDPETQRWMRVEDTPLAPCLSAPAAAPEDDGAKDVLVQAYQRALEQIEARPSDWKRHLAAAEVAVSLGSPERARPHFENAIEASPYNPRIAMVIKKLLPPAEWRGFRRLRRAERVWDDLGAIATYPVRSGPYPIAIAGVVLGGLACLPGGVWVAAVLAAAWVIYAARIAGRGANASDWRVAKAAWEFRGTIMAWLGGAGVALQLMSCMLAIAQLSIWLGVAGDGAGPWGTVVGSPLLTVLLTAMMLIYAPPAAIMLVFDRPVLSSALDPRGVFRVARRLDVEYVLTVVFCGILYSLWAALAMWMSPVPVLSEIVAGVTGSYLLLSIAFVLGRQAARHREELIVPATPAIPDRGAIPLDAV